MNSPLNNNKKIVIGKPKQTNKSFVQPVSRKVNNFLINPTVVEDHLSPERTVPNNNPLPKKRIVQS